MTTQEMIDLLEPKAPDWPSHSGMTATEAKAIAARLKALNEMRDRLEFLRKSRAFDLTDSPRSFMNKVCAILDALRENDDG